VSLPRSEGSLVRHDLPELLHRLSQLEWTGVLTLTRGGFTAGVKVLDGRLVFASSTDPDDRLGTLLLRKGKVTLRQIAAALEALRPPKRLGTVLVEQGVLQPEELIRAVTEHSSEIIYSTFQWVEGTYRMEHGVPEESITLKLSTPDIIMEGIRRIASWARIERAVGGVGARYRRRDDYEKLVSRMKLSFERLSMLTSLHGERTAQGICDESSLSNFETFQCLWAFRVIGVLERVDPVDSEPTLDDEGLDLVLGGG
jgi:hypothetical protein